jgi:tetratricopeptide (TPR) repeat protein
MLLGLVKTVSRNADWKNDFTLFTADVVTSKDSIKGNLAAAVSYLLESEKVNGSALAETYRARALDHAQQAVSLYEQYLGSDQQRGASYGHALALLCDCYGANGRLVEALQCYERVIRKTPDREPMCAKIEAAISKSNDVDFQIKNYSDFAALVPENFLFQYRLGYLYGTEKGDLPRSIHYLQKAIELRPKETHALEALSHAYKLLQDYDRAALYLEQAAAEEPGNRSHLTRLLAIYQLAGNRDKERDLRQRMGQPP